jgi:hypothetical protein
MISARNMQARLLPLIKMLPKPSKTVYQMKNTFETVTIEDDSTIKLLIFIQLNSFVLC